MGATFDPEGKHWTLVQEPAGWSLIGIGLLIGLVVAALVAASAYFIAIARGGVRLAPTTWSEVIVATVAFLVIHELVHTCVYPGGPFGASIRCGVDKGNPWVAFDGEMSRERRVAAKLAPTVVLSIAPIGAMLVLGSGWWWLVWAALVNLWGSGLDMITATTLLLQATANARVRDKGSHTWWATAQQADRADSRSLHSSQSDE